MIPKRKNSWPVFKIDVIHSREAANPYTIRIYSLSITLAYPSISKIF